MALLAPRRDSAASDAPACGSGPGPVRGQAIPHARCWPTSDAATSRASRTLLRRAGDRRRPPPPSGATYGPDGGCFLSLRIIPYPLRADCSLGPLPRSMAANEGDRPVEQPGNVSQGAVVLPRAAILGRRYNEDTTSIDRIKLPCRKSCRPRSTQCLLYETSIDAHKTHMA